ncbi:MAG: DUF445 domain-containing protein [Chitinophagaceae bacterium]|nr:DUF445 domain-containing protein [Chitinophagaceae bacterium]
MTLLQYLLPLLLSAFTGWFVIWLLIKILFRPHKPLGIAGFNIQGVLPANQQLIAQKIGKMVSAAFSLDTLKQKITDPENFNKLKPEIEEHIDSFLRERLKVTFPMLSMLIGDKTITQLKTAFLTELETLFPALMNSYVANLEKDLDIEKLVSEKISGFSTIQAEKLIYLSAKKQLIQVQLMGAGIGLLIGLIHILINAQLFT